MKITSLIENTRPPERSELCAEPGLSLHIQSGEHSILFDTGMSGAFADNASQLGVQLEDVTLAIISHHHIDHGGGLRRFFEANPHAPVFLRSPIAGQATLRAFGGLVNRSVGIDPAIFQEYAGRFHFVSDAAEPLPGVHLLTRIEKAQPLPKGNRYLYVQQDGRRQRDDFRHELILVVEEDGGLVIFTGCSHNGVLNMIATVLMGLPEKPVKALVGGFHQIGLPVFNHMAASKNEVQQLGQRLMQTPIKKIYTGHCTGLKAYPILKEVMGTRLDYLQTGSQIEL